VAGRSLSDLNPSTILLNGSVPIIAGSNTTAGGVLTVQFSKAAAVTSLGTPIPGLYHPTLQGRFANGDLVTAQAPITLVNATMVTIDIMPGTSPNQINLKAKGVLPVAILSTASFDATTVDPATVILAGAPAKPKKGGQPQFSTKDVNGDGRLDLVVQVLTEELALSAGATQAVLEGKTFSGTPIIGADAVQIVP
ncbi:MAG: hypothetical protein ACREJU_01530, partial [Nitrospiraceae bacterium]